MKKGDGVLFYASNADPSGVTGITGAAGTIGKTVAQLTFAPATGTLSSNFGWRTDPMHGSRRFHSGIDIAANHGTPIYATQAGQVAYSGKYGGYGNVVVLRHGDRYETVYAHNRRFHVAKGARVLAVDAANERARDAIGEQAKVAAAGRGQVRAVTPEVRIRRRHARTPRFEGG